MSYLLNYTHYLPDTEKRIERLKKIINGRPVAILLPGPSILELERRIGELQGDICYATVNDFWVMERRLTHRIGKNLTAVMCSAIECNVPSTIHMDFMNRREDNVFISELAGYHHNRLSWPTFYKDYGDKLLYFIADRSEKALTVPTEEYPLNFLAQASFAILTCLMAIGGSPLIVLFGADGGRIGKDLYLNDWQSDSESRLRYDTLLFNKTMPDIMERVNKLYGVKPTILNCSEQSHYTPFEKVSYNRAIKELR